MRVGHCIQRTEDNATTGSQLHPAVVHLAGLLAAAGGRVQARRLSGWTRWLGDATVRRAGFGKDD